MKQPVVLGVGLTAFGRRAPMTALDLMSEAAAAALEDAGVERAAVDGLLLGYATTLPHLMPATLFAEHFGLAPSYAHGLQVGGATGLAMIDLARHLVASGAVERMLVVAGENRLSGQSRDQTIKTLAQIGDPEHEVPNGASVPAYYALLASRYLAETQRSEEDLAGLSVLMRRHAQAYPGAHLRKTIDRSDVMASKPIAEPLKQLDCCPISDGAAAVLIGQRGATAGRSVQLTGGGQAHTHQHISAAPDQIAEGAGLAAGRALGQAGREVKEMQVLGIYDSFSVTLAALLEALGISAPGQAPLEVEAGRFNLDGDLPLNPHGGLLSYGHSGVAGGMAHFVEVVRQLRGTSPVQAARMPDLGLVHADGGVLSSHVSLVLEAET
ncbi:MAG: thiolase family protein [Pseudomonadota bacterium]